MSRPLLSASVIILLLAAGLAVSQKPKDAPLVAPGEARSPADEKKGFHLPPGFEAQLVASEPDINKPMNLAFDDRGRLWVTSTIEYPWPAKEGVKPRDSVKILDDFGPDGKARKVTTFADGLNIPIGVLPLGDGREALVHTVAYPTCQILRLTDTDGDGKADVRKVVLEGYGFDDTHGMTNAFTIGYDGWVYACHGFRNNSTVKAADGSQVTMNSGHVYRFKADGSRVEPWTYGQVNPFGLSFDALGNLFSADCHSRPLMQLLRGGVYQSFGKPHDGLGFAPEMMTHDHYSTGIAGVVSYAADQYPPEFRDSLFIGNVVTSRINRDTLDRHGTTLLAHEQPDFLISDDLWFRPVDFELGPDGALYVADFYNKIIGHYEVPLTHPGRDRESGRIWRIVYTGREAQSPRTDWTRATPAELVKDLDHANLTVRMKATHQLAARGKEGSAEVRKMLSGKPSPFQKAHGTWVLFRLDDLDDTTLSTLAADASPLVRVHVQKVLAEKTPWQARHHELAQVGLEDRDPFVQRAAADALGRHPSASNVRPLVQLRSRVAKDDTHLLHAVRMALRDQLRSAEVWKSLEITTWNEADSRLIADVAVGVVSLDAAKFLLRHLQGSTEEGLVGRRYVSHVACAGDADLDARLLDFVKERWKTNRPGQVLAFRDMVQGLEKRGAKLDEAGRAFAVEMVQRQLQEPGPSAQVQPAVELAESLRLLPVQNGLADLAEKGRPGLDEPADTPINLRIAAVKALLVMDPVRNIPVAGRVLKDANQPIALRDQTARLLGLTNRAEAMAILVEALPIAPTRVQTALAVALASSPSGGEKLLEACAAGKASPRLLQDRAVEVKLNEAKVANLKDRVAKLTAGLPPAEQKLQELIVKRRDGFANARPDVEAGGKLFEKHCAACHQIANKGAKVGPQLDGIGVRGLERLLEDVIDPNRNVDGAFRTTVLTTKDGRQVSGLLLRKEGEVLVLADNQGKEVRVPGGDVLDQAVSQLSPMPSNFVEQVGEAELYHVMGFLLNQKAAKP